MEYEEMKISPMKEVENIFIRGVFESILVLGGMAIFGNVGLMFGIFVWLFIGVMGTGYLHWFYHNKVNLEEKRFEVSSNNEAKLATSMSHIAITWKNSFWGKLPNFMPVFMSALIGGSVWYASGMVYPLVILVAMSIVSVIYRLLIIRHVSKILIKEE